MHALRALVEVASIERHRGPVAGSGVLGLISAMLVQPKTPAPVRALAFQAVGVLVAYDEHEQDARRAEEFGKLRSQVLAVGGVEMMAKCLMPTRSQDGVALCAEASACLIKICGDPGARCSDCHRLLFETDHSHHAILTPPPIACPAHVHAPRTGMRKGGALANAVGLLKAANDIDALEEGEGSAASSLGPLDMLDGGVDGSAAMALDASEAAFAWRRPALRLLDCVLRLALRPYEPSAAATDVDIELVTKFTGDGTCARLVVELGRFLVATVPPKSEEMGLALSVMAQLCTVVNVNADITAPAAPLVRGISLLQQDSSDPGGRSATQVAENAKGAGAAAVEDGGTEPEPELEPEQADWVRNIHSLSCPPASTLPHQPHLRLPARWECCDGCSRWRRRQCAVRRRNWWQHSVAVATRRI